MYSMTSGEITNLVEATSFLIQFELKSFKLNTVKFRYKRLLEIKTVFAVKTTCYSTKMQFSMQMGLINEICSLLRPLSTSTKGGLIIWTSDVSQFCPISYYLKC